MRFCCSQWRRADGAPAVFVPSPAAVPAPSPATEAAPPPAAETPAADEFKIELDAKSATPFGHPPDDNNLVVGQSFLSRYHHRNDFSLPVIHTIANGRALLDSDIEALMAFLHGCLSREEDFLFYHDLRDLPSWVTRAQIGVLIKFIREHKPQMDAHLKGIVVLINSAVVRGLVNFILHMFKPPQPITLQADPATADMFLQRHFPVLAAAIVTTGSEEAHAKRNQSVSA